MTPVLFFFRVHSAAVICDQTPECGGFTFKGILNSTNIADKQNVDSVLHEVYFFRYVHMVTTGQQFANWITYLSEKPYAPYHGLFQISHYESLEEEEYLGVRYISWYWNADILAKNVFFAVFSLFFLVPNISHKNEVLTFRLEMFLKYFKN